MTEVKAGVEYKINIDGNSFLLDQKKFNLLIYINESGSITEAAKRSKISYVRLLTIEGNLGKIGHACGCSSMVELQLPKLTTWVRFPSPAPLLCLRFSRHGGPTGGCRLSLVRPAVSPASLRHIETGGNSHGEGKI